MEDKNALGTAPVGRLMVKLAVPAVCAQLINALYNIVDRIYIGHMGEVGYLALTGLGVAFPIIMFISALSALAGWGAAPGPPSAWESKIWRGPRRSWGAAPPCCW